MIGWSLVRARRRNRNVGVGSAVAARYGFRRVEAVNIRFEHGSSAATVTGIAHRYPRAVRVPLAVAAQFIAAGAPLTIERPKPPHETVRV